MVDATLPDFEVGLRRQSERRSTSVESVSKAVEQRIAASPSDTFIRGGDFESLGSRVAIETALGRLCRRGELERLEKGLYWKGARTRFGVTSPHRLALALELTRHRAGGPTGATAAYFLSLATEMPLHPEIAIVGNRPAGRASEGIIYVMRSNALRAELSVEEIALLELARECFSRVEIDEAALARRLTQLLSEERIDPKRLAKAAAHEPMVARNALRCLPVPVLERASG